MTASMHVLDRDEWVPRFSMRLRRLAPRAGNESIAIANSEFEVWSDQSLELAATDYFEETPPHPAMGAR